MHIVADACVHDGVDVSVDAGDIYFLNVDLSEVFSVEDKFRVVPRLRLETQRV